jgi:hypothetical protein
MPARPFRRLVVHALSSAFTACAQRAGAFSGWNPLRWPYVRSGRQLLTAIRKARAARRRQSQPGVRWTVFEIAHYDFLHQVGGIGVYLRNLHGELIEREPMDIVAVYPVEEKPVRGSNRAPVDA